MPLFVYAIRDKLKKVLRGTAEADSEEDLRNRFRKQGYLVFSINKIDPANASKESKNLLKGLELYKLPMILLLIVGSYLLIKSTNRFADRFKEKESPVTAEAIPEETPVIEIPEIAPEEVISQPKQDIVVDKVVLEPKPKQKEGVIRIARKREARETSLDEKASANYSQAQEYYAKALKNVRSKNANSYLRKAINSAQKALRANEGSKEEILAFIRNCRKMLLRR